MRRMVGRVLEDIGNQPWNFELARQAVRSYPGTIDDALTQTREHFSKLKFNFVELETKLRFLEGLKTFDGTAASLPSLQGAHYGGSGIYAHTPPRCSPIIPVIGVFFLQTKT
jgi:hypothetical protein